jgi:hypothetical protein
LEWSAPEFSFEHARYADANLITQHYFEIALPLAPDLPAGSRTCLSD